MNEDRIAGTAKDLGGKAQEGIGKVMGDAKTELKGKLNQRSSPGSVWTGQGGRRNGDRVGA